MNKNKKSIAINKLSKQELTQIEGGVAPGPNGGCTPSLPGDPFVILKGLGL
jgi:bacteriocin-like protein